MSAFSKADYDYINLGVCIKNQADRLGIEHDGIPLEGVVVRIAERALSASVVTEEPEWEYGAQHSQGVNAHPSRARAEEMVAWHASSDDRKRPEARGKSKLVRRRKAGPWMPVKQGDWLPAESEPDQYQTRTDTRRPDSREELTEATGNGCREKHDGHADDDEQGDVPGRDTGRHETTVVPEVKQEDET